MAKLTLSTITSGYGSVAALNANFAAIATAFENTLSRDGTTPNSMSANIDMNSYRILNLGAPGNDYDPVRLIDLSDSDATGAASATLRSDLAASTGSSLVGHIALGTGAVARTVQSKLREHVSIGDYLTTDDASFAAALVYAASTGGTVLIPAGTWSLTSDHTVPANVRLDFSQGGILSIADGKTLTLAGEILAGDDQIFALTGTAKVVCSGPHTVNAGWWPNWTTDAGTCWTKAAAAIKNIGGKVILPGPATSTTCVDLTGFWGQSIIFEGRGNTESLITFNVATMCIDCTGSNRFTFKDFSYAGNSPTPDIGIFLARDAAGQNCLFHRFYNVTAQGGYNKAAIYSYASEENRFFNLYLQNSVGNACCFWSTGDNAGAGEGVTSVYAAGLQATGSQSNGDNQFFGCSFLSTGAGASTDNLRFRGTLNLNMYGTFFANTGASTPRSHIYVDTGLESSYIVIDGFRGETGTTVQNVIYLAGTGGLTHWRIAGGYSEPVAHALYADGASTMNFLTWTGNQGSGTNGFKPYHLSYSDIRDGGAVTIQGNAISNTIAAQKANITISGADAYNMLFYYDEGSQRVILSQSATAPVITNGSTIAVAGVGIARVAPGGAVTGIILALGKPGQILTVVNESAAGNTVTFAASGTSNVADGAGSVIAGTTAATFVYNSAAGLWYRC